MHRPRFLQDIKTDTIINNENKGEREKKKWKIKARGRKKGKKNER